MKLLIAISDSESNILAGQSAGCWAFTEKKDRNGISKQFYLQPRNYSMPGNYITFWTSEKEGINPQGFMGLGIITGNQIRGKVERNIWNDRDYYGAIPFKLISSKKMPIDEVRKLYGSTWNRSFNVLNGNLPEGKITDEQMKEFIIYMIT